MRDPGVYLFELPTDEDPVLRRLAIEEMKRLRDEFKRTVVYAAGTVDDLDDLADWVVVLGRRAQAANGQPGADRSNGPPRAGSPSSWARDSAPRAWWARRHDAVTVRLKDGAIVTIPCESDDAAAGERATLAIWPEHMDREGEDGGLSRPSTATCSTRGGTWWRDPSGPPLKRKTKGGAPSGDKCRIRQLSGALGSAARAPCRLPQYSSLRERKSLAQIDPPTYRDEKFRV